MKISVLLSLFAKENPAYFELAMQSIWDNQIRKPDEIVLVEDGELPAQLEKIVCQWENRLGSVLKVIRNKENQGLAIALNEGLWHCTGDYIARMDTDDISLPERFKLQVEYAATHPDVVLFGGGMIEFDDETGEMPPRIMPTTQNAIKDAMCKTNPFVHPAVFIKKSVMQKGYLYNPQCCRNQDLELWYRILSANYAVANLDKVILKFRKTANMYAKRKKSAGSEYRICSHGIRLLYGRFSWRQIYPVVHFCFRILPESVALFVYKKFISSYWNRRQNFKN